MARLGLYSLHVEVPLGEWNSFVVLYAAACGTYEQSACSCRRLINYTSIPFPAGETIGKPVIIL